MMFLLIIADKKMIFLFIIVDDKNKMMFLLISPIFKDTYACTENYKDTIVN